MAHRHTSQLRRRTPNQAHPARRHHPLAGSLLLVLGIAMLAAATLGTAAGTGRSEAARPAGFAPLVLGSPGAGREARLAEADPTGAPVAALAAVDPEPAETCAAPVAVSTPVPTPAPTATPRPVQRVPRPVAAFLGDSYTTGWAGAGLGRAGWPSIVAAANGWRVINRAVAGTGFVNPGWTAQPMRTRVSAIIEARPGIVFVAGGHNDRRFGAAATARAAGQVLDRLRAGLPDAVIVVVGPIWQSGSPPPAIVGIRDQLRRKAAAIGALFIDPLRQGWFAGSARSLILADGIHPSNAGHRRMAAKVLAALEADPRTGPAPAPVAAAPSPSPSPAPARPVAVTACAR